MKKFIFAFFLFSFFVFLFIGDYHREEEIKTEEVPKEEKVTVIKPVIIFKEEGVVVSEAELNEYMKEIEKSTGKLKLSYNNLKEAAIERAIIVTAENLYFKEKGITAREDEVDEIMDSLHRRKILEELLKDFYSSEIERVIAFEIKANKLILRLIKEKELTIEEARNLIEEEINEKILELFHDAEIRVVPALWI